MADSCHLTVYCSALDVLMVLKTWHLPTMASSCNNSSALCSGCEAASRLFRLKSDHCLNFSYLSVGKRTNISVANVNLSNIVCSAPYMVSFDNLKKSLEHKVTLSHRKSAMPLCVYIGASDLPCSRVVTQTRLNTFLARIYITVISPWHSCPYISLDPNWVGRCSERKRSP